MEEINWEECIRKHYVQFLFLLRSQQHQNTHTASFLFICLSSLSVIDPLCPSFLCLFFISAALHTSSLCTSHWNQMDSHLLPAALTWGHNILFLVLVPRAHLDESDAPACGGAVTHVPCVCFADAAGGRETASV